MPLDKALIPDILEAISREYLPEGYHEPRYVFQFTKDGKLYEHAIIRDLQSMGKRYDFADPGDVIRAAEDAYTWNLRLLKTHHNLSEATMAVSPEAAFVLTTVLGHEGAIPYLTGKTQIPERLAPLIEEIIEPNGETNEAAPPSAPERNVTVTAALPTLSPAPLDVPQREPELPEIEVTLPEYLVQEQEQRRHTYLRNQHEKIIEGELPIIRKGLAIAENKREIENDSGKPLNPYEHDPQNATTTGEIALPYSLGYPSAAFVKANELTEDHGSAPLFGPTQQGAFWQFPQYGYAEGFRAAGVSPEEYPRIHRDDGHHAHNPPDFVSASYDTQTGPAGQFHFNLHDDTGNSAVFNGFASADEQRLRFVAYKNAGGEPNYQGRSFQAAYTREAAESPLDDAESSLDAAVMSYTSFPDLTVGVGPVLHVASGDGALRLAPGIRSDISALDPWTAKVGGRLFTDVTTAAVTGELELATETLHIGRPQAHLSYHFHLPYQGKSEHALHGRFAYPFSPRDLISHETELAVNEGWTTSLKYTRALSNPNWAVSSSASFGNLEEAAFNGTAETSRSLNLRLGVELNYLNLPQNITGAVEVGLDEVGSQPTPYGQIKVTKLIE